MGASGRTPRSCERERGLSRGLAPLREETEPRTACPPPPAAPCHSAPLASWSELCPTHTLSGPRTSDRGRSSPPCVWDLSFTAARGSWGRSGAKKKGDVAERLTPGGSGTPPLPSPAAVGSFRPLHAILLRCPHVGHYRTSSRSPHAPCPPRARSPQPGILQGNLCGCHRKRGPQGARCSGAGRRKWGSRARRGSKVPTEPPTFLRPPRIYVARMGFGVHCCQGRAGQAPPAPDVSTWTLSIVRIRAERRDDRDDPKRRERDSVRYFVRGSAFRPQLV